MFKTTAPAANASLALNVIRTALFQPAPPSRMNDSEVPGGFVEFDREGLDLPRAFYEATAGGVILACDLFFLLVIVTKSSVWRRKEFIVLAASIVQDAFYGAVFLDKGRFKLATYYSGDTRKFRPRSRRKKSGDCCSLRY